MINEKETKIYSTKNAAPRELLRLVRQEVQTIVSEKGEQTNVSYLSSEYPLNRCNPGGTQDLHPVCIYPLNRFPSTQGESERWREATQLTRARDGTSREETVQTKSKAHTQELCDVEYEGTDKERGSLVMGKTPVRWCRRRRGWKAAWMSTESASPPGERQN